MKRKGTGIKDLTPAMIEGYAAAVDSGRPVVDKYCKLYLFAEVAERKLRKLLDAWTMRSERSRIQVIRESVKYLKTGRI